MHTEKIVSLSVSVEASCSYSAVTSKAKPDCKAMRCSQLRPQTLHPTVFNCLP
jgi:hypothetical protein